MRSMMCRYIITKQWVEHKAFARTKISSLVGYSRVSNAVRVNSQDKLKLLNSFTFQVMLFIIWYTARITYVKANLSLAT